MNGRMFQGTIGCIQNITSSKSLVLNVEAAELF